MASAAWFATGLFLSYYLEIQVDQVEPLKLNIFSFIFLREPRAYVYVWIVLVHAKAAE